MSYQYLYSNTNNRIGSTTITIRPLNHTHLGARKKIKTYKVCEILRFYFLIFFPSRILAAPMNVSPSNEIVTLISDVTDQEAVSEVVNSYYVKSTSAFDRTAESVCFVINLDKQIQQSRTARVLHFKNFIEQWETDRINLKNDKCKSSLL